MGSILRRVREFVPGVRAVNLPLSGCGRAHCYISMTKHADGEPKQAAFVALATEYDIRMVIVVDDDVNVFNETEVLWAVATRFDAREDLTVMENCMGIKHVPVAYDVTHTQHGGMTTKMILDATRPAPPADFPKRAVVPEEVLQDIHLDRYLEPFHIESLAPTPVSV
jgi:2,5-furandicarboxylate decarboxylase 1